MKNTVFRSTWNIFCTVFSVCSTWNTTDGKGAHCFTWNTAHRQTKTAAMVFVPSPPCESLPYSTWDPLLFCIICWFWCEIKNRKFGIFWISWFSLFESLLFACFPFLANRFFNRNTWRCVSTSACFSKTNDAFQMMCYSGLTVSLRSHLKPYSLSSYQTFVQMKPSLQLADFLPDWIKERIPSLQKDCRYSALVKS